MDNTALAGLVLGIVGALVGILSLVIGLVDYRGARCTPKR